MNKSRIVSLVSLIALLLGGCNLLPLPSNGGKPNGSTTDVSNTVSSSSSLVEEEEPDEEEPGDEEPGDDDTDPDDIPDIPSVDPNDYYHEVTDDLNGTALLRVLQGINKTARKRMVGYDSMGTGTSGDFIYTDYDPNYVQYTADGHPYGTRVLSFYTHTSTTGGNREHVWPNSHGGGEKADFAGPWIEDDIHMTRPTISSENSSRGNSFYVEGMCHSSDGWDPYSAGYSADSRGDAARIILYGVVADTHLCLAPFNTSPSSGNDPITGIAYGSKHTMGNLETLLKWNLDYPVVQREQNRNEGAEYLQGNRNPFIDHPEYACRIWGSVTDNTKQTCGIS